MAALFLHRPDHLSQKRPLKITLRYKKAGATDGAQAITVWAPPSPSANGGGLRFKNTGGATDGAPAVITGSAPPPPVVIAVENRGLKKTGGGTDGGAPASVNGGAPINRESRVAAPARKEEDFTAVRERNRRKQKRFSLSLTKEEREEDMKAIGQYLKPNRRIEKKPATAKLQRTKDMLFPGLNLNKITENSYAVKNFR